MFHDQRLKELEAEQELLVAQSDLCRHTIYLQFETIRGQLAWTNPVGQVLSSSNPWVLGGAVLGLSLLFTRLKSGVFRWVPAAMAAWRLARSLFQK